MTFEVTEPILCSPYAEPDHHWFIPEGGTPVKREGALEELRLPTARR